MSKSEATPQPQYVSQPMIGRGASARPSVTPWLYTSKLLGSRFVALALTVIDAVVSYAGLRAAGASRIAAIAGCLFIALFQGAIALALTSGQPVGERFQARFFDDTGVIGVIKRCLGVLLILLGVGLYLWDIVSNYWAFTGGRFLPLEEGAPVTSSTVVLAIGFIIMAVCLTLGDEMLHCIADEIELGAAENAVRYRGAVYEARLTDKYQRHYMKTARSVADNLGAEHGQQWRPRDLR